MIVSTPSKAPPAAIDSAKSLAVAMAVFIFQLPAMIGVRATLGSELH